MRIWLRRAFWKNFGTNLDDAWSHWPEQEFQDAVSVLNSEAQASRTGSGGGGSIPAETTQANFDALPRIPRPEEPPQEPPPA